jgi:heme exporter protein A
MAAPPADPSSLLAVEELECRRGERTLFSGLGFSVAPGAIVWLRGANGQGKTTLLRTLAGLSRPEAGRIVWREPAGTGRALYLAHANALKDELSAAESLAFLHALDGRESDPAGLAAALERVGMASRRAAPVRTLSQGQRRRVALARLAAPGTASTWLLDEPFDALDAAGVEMLNGLLAEHAARGGGIVLTSHVPLTIAAPLPATVSLDAAASA